MSEKREKQREDRKKQILSLSLTMFIERGYYGTSTRAIANEAGISSGLIFNYFKTKDEIYETLISIGCEKMVPDLQEAELNPYSYLEKMTKEILKQLQINSFFAKMFVFIDQAQHTVGISEKAREMLRSTDITKTYSQIIEKGQKMGQFRSGNVQALTVAFFSMIQGIAQEKVRTPDTKLPEAEWMLDVLGINKNN